MKAWILRATLVAAILLYTAIPSRAQDTKPEAPEGVKNLMKFLGRWDATATLVIEGKTHIVPYHVDFRKIADGNGLYADEWFSDPELGSMKGGNLVGYDPFDSRIHWYSVDNMGTTHEHIGNWQTPDHLSVEHNGMRDGKKYVEKMDITFTSKDELDFKLVATLDGKEVESGEGVFHRKALTARK